MLPERAQVHQALLHSCSRAAPGMRLGCRPRFPARRLGAGRPRPHPLPRPHILRASVRPAFPARDMAGSSEKAPDSGRGVVVNANSGFRAPLARSPPFVAPLHSHLPPL